MAIPYFLRVEPIMLEQPKLNTWLWYIKSINYDNFNNEQVWMNQMINTIILNKLYNLC